LKSPTADAMSSATMPETHGIKFLFDMTSFLTSDDRVGHEFRCINNTSFPEAGTTRIWDNYYRFGGHNWTLDLIGGVCLVNPEAYINLTGKAQNNDSAKTFQAMSCQKPPTPCSKPLDASHVLSKIFSPSTSSCAIMPAAPSIPRRPLLISLFCMALSSAGSVGLRPNGSK